LRELALLSTREADVKVFTHDEIQDGVPEKLQAFVGTRGVAGTLQKGAVEEGLYIQVPVSDGHPEGALEGCDVLQQPEFLLGEVGISGPGEPALQKVT
jgi:hypothetical protein